MAGYHFPAESHVIDATALSQVERLAAECLRTGFVSFDTLMSMCVLLPADSVRGPSGISVEPRDPKTFTSGAFVHLNNFGLRSNFRVFPVTSSLLARVLSAQFPGRMFSTVGLFFNVKAPVHSDANNDHRHPNLLLPASSFLDGQVWVEGKGTVPCPDPQVRRCGYLLPVHSGPQLLPSQRLHCTCDWQGSRLLLVGFCIRDSSSLSQEHRLQLHDAGFRLPSPDNVPDLATSTMSQDDLPSAEVPSTPSVDLGDPSPHQVSAATAAKRPRVAYRQPVAATGTSAGVPTAPPNSLPSVPQVPRNAPTTRPQTSREVFPTHVAPLVLEVFAGTARLSSVCQRIGFRALAVDKVSTKSRFPIQQLDLTLADDLTLLLDIIRLEAGNLAWIHCAPPCGTASAARARPLKGVQTANFHAPVPLRSPREPQGLSTLSGLDRTRVEQANLLYKAVGTIVDLAMELQLFITIENPANSLAWLCDGLDHLFRCPHHEVIFDSCMHGGNRDKRTLLWCSDPRFRPLALLCSKYHPHASWRPRVVDGQVAFPTKEEAAYPHLLCERMAYIVAAHYDNLLDVVPELRQPTQVNLQRQPRLARPLVSCYGAYDSWAVPVRSAAFLEALLRCYPKGARVVQRKLVPWGMVRVCMPSLSATSDFSALERGWKGNVRMALEEQQFLEQLHHEETVQVCGVFQADDPCSTSAELIVLGIPREPDDFVKEAIKAGHPRNGLSASRAGPAVDVVDAVLLPFEDREAKAAKTRQKWAEIERSTRPLNDKILKDKPEYLRKALGSKNVLAWRGILRSNGFGDDQLWADLRDGFRLTGWMRDTGLFDKKLRPPETTLERLLEQSTYRTPLALNKLRKTVVDETARKAWAETLEEERKGWIYKDTAPVDQPIILAHRFGLNQKGKVRVIDNGKECGLNLACGLPEKFTLHGIDVLAGIFIELLNRPAAKNMRLKGRTIDLVSAYKFYPIHPKDRKHLRIGVYDTDARVVRLYGTNVLPFGATGSVAGFLRVSSALWHTGVRDMGLGWSAYFDDFPLLAAEGHESQVNSLAGEVFDALQVEYAKEGKKAVDFASIFSALGLSFDLTRFAEGVVTIRHTEARTSELLETISEILNEGRLKAKDAEVLRGRMHWYTSYLFGRAPCQAMHQISLRAQGHDSCTALTTDLEDALKFMRAYLKDARPLELRQTTGREMFIFTDGSYEPDGKVKAGIGGVLYDDSGTALAFFSSEVEYNDLLILENQSNHPIYEVELYAAIAAFELWGHLIQDSFSVFFLDNEAAQAALIAGKSSTKNGRSLVQRFLDAEHRWRARPWIGRVPTSSNPADAPSRGICNPLLGQGAKQMELPNTSLLR